MVSVPILTWRPTRFAVGVAVALAVVWAAVTIPWWAHDPAMVLRGLVFIPVITVFVFVFVTRALRVWNTHQINAGYQDDRRERSRRFWHNYYLVIEPYSLVYTLVLIWVAMGISAYFNTDIWGPLRAGAVFTLVIAAIAALAWRFSPWFHVRLHLGAAFWCGPIRREVYMQRALEADPGPCSSHLR